MSGAVDYRVEDAIAVITLENPPVNALSHAVRAGLDAAISRFSEDAEARIAVLVGAGRLFCGGADVAEFGQPSRGPILRDVVNRIESCPKPVIAVIQGAALGGGLEVAMGAHYRLALPGSRLGLPEVLLGMMPGAGGTQRLPRLIEAEDALEMMTTGAPIDAERALALGLIDRLGKTDDPLTEGLEFAADLLSRAAPPRPVSAMRPPDIDETELQRWRVRLMGSARGHVAPLFIVDAVAAAAASKFSAGLNEERKLYRDLMETPQRAALVHAFMADRKLAAPPRLAGVAARRVLHLGIVGDGTVGTAMATAALIQGLRVTLVTPDQAAAPERALGKVAVLVDQAISRGDVDAAARAALLDKSLTVTAQPEALADADMVIEAVPEDMVQKLAVIANLDRLCKPDAVLATTSAGCDLNVLADAAENSGRVVGLHPLVPPPDLRLIEVTASRQSAPEALATSFALMKRLDLRAVLVGPGAGQIGNRITAHCRAAVDRMVMEGASPYQIDTALTDFGLALGPYQQADLAGYDDGPTDSAAADILAALCRNGWRGRAAGRGFYRYDTGDPEGLPDPEVEMLVARARHDADIVPRRLTDNEVIRRYIAALVNEAAKALAEGVVARPLDIDMVFVHGCGFPRWRGGPLHYADRVGPANILADIHRYAETDPIFWKAAPLLIDLVETKKTFAILNRA